MSNKVYNKIEKVQIGNTVYGVMVVQCENKVVTINVQKLTNNPWKSLGKDYQTWEECLASYKNTNMKIALNLIKAKYEKSIETYDLSENDTMIAINLSAINYNKSIN